MELKPHASIVHKIHFRRWRLSGQAFELRDSAYVAPNRTVASMAAGRLRGSSVLKRGFWGDVTNSPYSALGVECDDERLLKQVNGQHVKTACDVAYYNVLCWLTALETGRSYSIKSEDFEDFEYGGSVASGGLSKGFLATGGKPQLAIEELEEEEAPVASEQAAAAEQRRVKAAAAAARLSKVPQFKLRLASGDWKDVLRKPKHAQRYDVVTVSNHQVHFLLDERFNGLLRPRSVVVLETAKFIVETRKQNRVDFGKKLHNLAACRGWTPVAGGKADGSEVSHLAFRFDSSTAEELAEAAREKLGLNARPATQQAATTEEPSDMPLLELTCKDALGESGEATADGTVGELELVRGAAASAMDVAAPAAAAAASAEPQTAIDAASGRVCTITGLPAKYRDPISGLPYANLEAFRELRKLHPDPRATEQERPNDMGEASAPPPNIPQRPIIVSTGPTRRINKIV